MLENSAADGPVFDSKIRHQAMTLTLFPWHISVISLVMESQSQFYHILH